MARGRKSEKGIKQQRGEEKKFETSPSKAKSSMYYIYDKHSGTRKDAKKKGKKKREKKERGLKNEEVARERKAHEALNTFI